MKKIFFISALLAGFQFFMNGLCAEDIPVRAGAEALVLIKRAVDAQAEEVVLPRSTYRFQGNERMVLSRIKNLRIDGAGSTFLFDRRGKFTVNECRNLTVENIMIDYDPLPFTQGVVVGVNEKAKSIRVRFDEGFHAPGSPGFPLSVKANGTMGGGVRFLDATGEYMHAMLWEAGTLVNPQSPDGDIYEIRLYNGRLFHPGVRPDSLKAGDRFTLFSDGGEALEVTHCERVVFRNVNIYSAPGFGISEKRGKGGNVYENCRLIRKPGSGRLMVSTRDGFHSYLVETGPTLKGCEISYTADDAIAIHGFFNPVIKAIDSKTIYLLCPYGLNTSKGDRLSFYDQEDGRPLGNRTVLQVENLSPDEGRKELDAWRVALKNAGARTLRGISDGQWAVAKIELDGAVELSDLALADSGAFAGAGAEIRDCHIHDTTSRGLLIRSPGAKIIGNRIERTALAPVALMAERYWLEGPFLDRIEVSGNTIIDAPLPALDTRHFDYGFAAIQVASIFGTRSFNPPEFNQQRQNRRIRITDNHVVRPAGPAIAVLNAEDVVISRNRIESPFAAGISGNPLNLLRTLAPSGPVPSAAQSEVAAKPWYGILLMAVDNAEVIGNTLVKADQGVLGPVGVGPWTENVRVSVVVFEDDFTYTGWTAGPDPMNAVWTSVVNTPTLPSGTGAWPTSCLRLNNSTVSAVLDAAVTRDFSLTVTMFGETYGRSHWFAITDSAGANGYYIRWDGAAANQYDGQGIVRIGKISSAIAGYQTNPGTSLTPIIKSGYQAAGNNAIPFATITLTWAASSNTLELWVNGEKKQEVVDASFASFSRLYLSGNADGLYGSVSLSTVPLK